MVEAVLGKHYTIHTHINDIIIYARQQAASCKAVEIFSYTYRSRMPGCHIGGHSAG
jgi:hypothetical protein